MCLCVSLSCTFEKAEWVEQNLTLKLQTAIVNLDTTHSCFMAQIACLIPGTARPLCDCETLQSAPSGSQTRKERANTHTQPTFYTHTDGIHGKHDVSVLARLHTLLNAWK